MKCLGAICSHPWIERRGILLTRRLVVALALTLGASSTVRGQDPEFVPGPPICLHPDNPRYFLWRDKPTVLITSGEHYGALLNLDFDYNRYLATLAEDGLNHTRTFSGVYREVGSSFGITDNTLAPKPLRYICPWARSDVAGYRDGGNKFDLTKWDSAYFSRLRDFMNEARRRGIVVELTLFCTFYRDELWDVSPLNALNNVNGIGVCPREEVFTLKHADLLDVHLAFVRKVVEELREYDNLYYEVCNEPYFHGVSMNWQHRIVEEIIAAEEASGHKHLISLNVANGRAKITEPHPGVSIFNFHYCVPPDVIALNAGVIGVIGENETGFRGRDDLLYRTEAWDFVLAGGALFNNLDYSFTPTHPGGTLLDYRSPGGGSAALRKQLGILKTFLSGFDFIRMKPHPEVVVKCTPELTASALAEAGKAYAVYMHVPLPHKPKNLDELRRADLTAHLTLNLAPGAYSVEWIDTKTGLITGSESLKHGGGNCLIQSPTFSDDVALRLLATE